MLKSYLEYCIYPDKIFDGKYECLPAVKLHDQIEMYFDIGNDTFFNLRTKLEQSSRKLCMMWHASEEAKLAEAEFYTATISEAPALFGEHAIKVHYNLEALVLFARSAMDIASTAFGWSLPKPFEHKRYDSFNSLIKAICKDEYSPLTPYFNDLRKDETSWLSIIAGTEKGRSLRDKLAHQTEFPIEYTELNPNSEKRSAVVCIGTKQVPLHEFIDSLCHGVLEGFLRLEEHCLAHINRVEEESINR